MGFHAKVAIPQFLFLELLKGQLGIKIYSHVLKLYNSLTLTTYFSNCRKSKKKRQNVTFRPSYIKTSGNCKKLHVPEKLSFIAVICWIYVISLLPKV